MLALFTRKYCCFKVLRSGNSTVVFFKMMDIILPLYAEQSEAEMCDGMKLTQKGSFFNDRYTYLKILWCGFLDNKMKSSWRWILLFVSIRYVGRVVGSRV